MDHTTVIHSCQLVQGLIDIKDSDFKWVKEVCENGFRSIIPAHGYDGITKITLD